MKKKVLMCYSFLAFIGGCEQGVQQEAKPAGSDFFIGCYASRPNGELERKIEKTGDSYTFQRLSQGKWIMAGEGTLSGPLAFHLRSDAVKKDFAKKGGEAFEFSAAIEEALATEKGIDGALIVKMKKSAIGPNKFSASEYLAFSGLVISLYPMSCS